MAGTYLQSAIGLEITEEFLIITEIKALEEGVQVSKSKIVDIPPRVVNNGEITDPELLSEQISKTLAELEIKSDNIVVSLRDDQFLKQVEKFSAGSQNAMKDEVDVRVSGHYLFAKDEFESGYQLPIDLDFGVQNKNIPVLFAAMSLARVESIRELISVCGLNLVAVDLGPLAILRAMVWDGHVADQLVLFIVLEPTYADLTIMDNEDVLATFMLRQEDLNDVKEAGGMDEFKVVIRNFVLSFNNDQPDKGRIDRVILFTRYESLNPVIDDLKSYFSDYDCEVYSAFSNVPFDGQRYSEKSDAHAINQGLVSIGLALKYFEKFNKTLSLTRVRKQIGPIFNRFELTLAGGALAGVIGVILLLSFYLTTAANRVENRINLTKDEIRSLQTGEFLSRQKRLESLESQIATFEKLRNQTFSKTALIQTIVDGLPSDISFRSFIVDPKLHITIQGSSYTQDSIYAFYNKMKHLFKNVELKGIQIDYVDDVPMNHFVLMFDWI